MKNDIKEVLFTEEQLKQKVAELGAQITADYQGKNPLIVSVLKGSYVFMADLTRRIDVPGGFHGRVQLRRGHKNLWRGANHQGP